MGSFFAGIVYEIWRLLEGLFSTLGWQARIPITLLCLGIIVYLLWRLLGLVICGVIILAYGAATFSARRRMGGQPTAGKKTIESLLRLTLALSLNDPQFFDLLVVASRQRRRTRWCRVCLLVIPTLAVVGTALLYGWLSLTVHTIRTATGRSQQEALDRAAYYTALEATPFLGFFNADASNIRSRVDGRLGATLNPKQGTLHVWYAPGMSATLNRSQAESLVAPAVLIAQAELEARSQQELAQRRSTKEIDAAIPAIEADVMAAEDRFNAYRTALPQDRPGLRAEVFSKVGEVEAGLANVDRLSHKVQEAGGYLSPRSKARLLSIKAIVNIFRGKSNEEIFRQSEALVSRVPPQSVDQLKKSISSIQKMDRMYSGRLW